MGPPAPHLPVATPCRYAGAKIEFYFRGESCIDFRTQCVIMVQTRWSSTIPCYLPHSQNFDKIDSFLKHVLGICILGNLILGWGEWFIKEGVGIVNFFCKRLQLGCLTGSIWRFQKTLVMFCYFNIYACVLDFTFPKKMWLIKRGFCRQKGRL